jgi:hypothetical protein
VTGLLPARLAKDGVTVLCGSPSCSCVLGRVLPEHLILSLGLVELRDSQGKPYRPPCYAQPRSLRERVGAAARTGRRISPFRARAAHAMGHWFGDRALWLATLDEVWIKCPKCPTKSVFSPLETKHGATG